MYTITFEDGTQFKGGNPRDSKWNEIGNKRIKQLAYKFGTQLLVLQDYEAYNHLPYNEAILGMGSYIPGLFIMGKWGNQIDKFYLNFKNGRIYHSLAIAGQEYQGKAVEGWKRGTEKLALKGWLIL